MDLDVARGFMISSDVAHGLHPNYPEKNDITNFPVLNGGVTLKQACSQSYAGDAKAYCHCERPLWGSRCSIPNLRQSVRYFRAAQSVGSISSAMLPMRTIDVGLPLLAMHSARELMGAADQEQLNRLMNHFLGGK